ncbi:hypothetical protein QNI19_32740 [Cytophagaceae bacterium DM2B3-1]|uniref:Type II secretion system protein n=1 Tax=Xanthocytophaga flava TaxID=3048013 RepID=A0ABT7CYV2_9BACT|nr:hypothetical protein [Xanthocytophaga flavus]MDJ1497754.1 hypothetical protein [Xanthocytophaga flavus]
MAGLNSEPAFKRMINRKKLHWLSTTRLLLFKRLKASSMVELTVAMVVLTLVTGAALLLYMQVTRSGTTIQGQRWQLWLNHYAQQTKQQSAYQNTQLAFPEGTVTREIALYQNNPNLLLLTLTFTPIPETDQSLASSSTNTETGLLTIPKQKAYIHQEIIYLDHAITTK